MIALDILAMEVVNVVRGDCRDSGEGATMVLLGSTLGVVALSIDSSSYEKIDNL